MGAGELVNPIIAADVGSGSTVINEPAAIVRRLDYPSLPSPTRWPWSRYRSTLTAEVVVSHDEGADLIERIKSELPSWAVVVVMDLLSIKSLREDWDSYGGLPIDSAKVDQALVFLALVMNDDSPAPDVVPLADGGIQLSWQLPTGELDFISDSEDETPGVWLTTGEGSDPLPANDESVARIREMLKPTAA